jgi:hypothetical protein
MLLGVAQGKLKPSRSILQRNMFCLRHATLSVSDSRPSEVRKARTGGIDMPLQSHLVELERKHQALEREIQDALNHPSMDDTKLAELKRRKLQLKDQITRLKSAPQAVH